MLETHSNQVQIGQFKATFFHQIFLVWLWPPPWHRQATQKKFKPFVSKFVSILNAISMPWQHVLYPSVFSLNFRRFFWRVQTGIDSCACVRGASDFSLWCGTRPDCKIWTTIGSDSFTAKSGSGEGLIVSVCTRLKIRLCVSCALWQVPGKFAFWTCNLQKLSSPKVWPFGCSRTRACLSNLFFVENWFGSWAVDGYCLVWQTVGWTEPEQFGARFSVSWSLPWPEASVTTG